jgi:poly-beta-1,6-N-acetyl-D-glucosamine synthase
MGVFIFVLLLCSLGYSALFGLYIKGWDAVDEEKTTSAHICKTSITVIMPARNEANFIAKAIDSILLQQYDAQFELIVINDHSTDNTQHICESYGDRIRLINLNETLASGAYKKKAISEAIAIAHGSLIVTTDADTQRGVLWLQSMAQYYEQHNCKMIAGPVNYISQNSWLAKFQIIDFLCMQGVTAASLKYRFNSTCNGANLAYTKKAFETVGGFAGIDHIASGDDMLLLHKIEQAYPTGVHYLKNKNAIVSTYGMENIFSFFQQRIRWASKAKHYTDKRVSTVLGLVWVYNLLMLVQLVLLYKSAFSLSAGIIYFAIKIIAEQLLLNRVASFFGHQHLRWWHIILQPAHIAYIVSAGLLGLVKKYEWKGRKL